MLIVILKFYTPMLSPAVRQFQEIDMLVLQDMPTGEIKLTQILTEMKVDQRGIQEDLTATSLADIIDLKGRLLIVHLVEVFKPEDTMAHG